MTSSIIHLSLKRKLISIAPAVFIYSDYAVIEKFIYYLFSISFVIFFNSLLYSVNRIKKVAD